MSRFNINVPSEVIPLYLKGESYRSIAEQLGVSHPIIRKAVIAAGFKSRPAHAPRQFNHAAILQLKHEGKTVKEISDTLNIKYNTVWGIISNKYEAIDVRPFSDEQMRMGNSSL